MESVLVDKIVEDLEAEGMEVVSTSKPSRGFLYKLGKFSAGSSLPNAKVITVKKDGFEEKFFAIEKDSAKKEYEKLKMINNDKNLKKIVNVPKPRILLEERNIIVMDHIEGKALSETLVENNFFLGLKENKIKNILQRIGKKIAKMHNTTKIDKKHNIKKEFIEKRKNCENYLDNDLVEEINQVPVKNVETSKVFIHGHVGPGNVKLDGNDIKLIDWSDCGYRSKLFEINRSEEIFRKFGEHIFTYNLYDYWKSFFQAYKKNINTEIKDYPYHLSRINFLLEKIKHSKKDLYIDMLKESISYLKSC